MDQASLPLQITVNFQDIVNKCTSHLSSIADNINLLYHSAAAYSSEEIPQLPTDTLPIVIEATEKKSIEEMRASVFLWMFTKGVTDIISALHESLIEAYKAIGMMRFFLDEGPKGMLLSEFPLAIEEKMKKLGSAACKMFLPALLKHVEVQLNVPLLYTKEILSINTIRRCLVHENGKAIPTKPDGAVKLEYLTYVFFFTTDGVKKEMTWEDKINRAISGKISHGMESRSVTFPVNSNIIIDHNIFTALVFTSVMFAQQLRTTAYEHFASPRQPSSETDNASS